MRAMIVDGGARGQAIASKLAGEGHDVFVSPGNPGNDDFATSTRLETVDILGNANFARRNSIDMTLITADDPLALGMVDEFRADNLPVFGPTKAQARIEWDRDYAKVFARKYGVPTGPYASFRSSAQAADYALARQWPLFVKENGLAQGKGATKCQTIEEFIELLDSLDSNNFFESGKTLIIEDYVTGPEASHHAFCDGKIQLSIPFLVRDHKQLGEQDTGPMTGGMGVVGPLPGYSVAEVQSLGETFVTPIVRELGFKGVLFSGLKGVKGHEQNLEWNARPGDPETQVYLRLMQSELMPLVMACVEGDLENLPPPVWRTDQAAVSLVLAAPGYPNTPQKGMVIDGIEEAMDIPGVEIVHGATKVEKNKLLTDGGRVLNIVAMASNLERALNQAYTAASAISFSSRPPIIRRDIGETALAGN